MPIIFVSALSETNEKVGGFELGAVDFATKPYQREELLIRVRTHLEMTCLCNRLGFLVDERTNELRADMSPPRGEAGVISKRSVVIPRYLPS